MKHAMMKHIKRNKCQEEDIHNPHHSMKLMHAYLYVSLFSSIPLHTKIMCFQTLLHSYSAVIASTFDGQ
jgi:hypothetical protein